MWGAPPVPDPEAAGRRYVRVARALAILIAAVTFVTQGYAVQLLWRWFAERPLHLAAPTYPECLGLILLWQVLAMEVPVSHALIEESADRKNEALTRVTARLLELLAIVITMGAGWSIHALLGG